MKKLIAGAGVLVAVAALTVATVVVARTLSSRTGDGPAAADFVRVARRDVGTIVKATGVIKPRVGAEVRVGSRISGVVKRLYVRVGDAVEKGQALADLDDRDLVARRDEAAAALRQAAANLSFATTDLQRRRDLGAEGLIPASERDLAERASAVAGEQVAAAEASLAFAATQVEYARIRAPIRGVVAAVTTQEGETVAASLAAPTFVTLLDLARLEVWAYVDETDIGRIRPGQKARFTVDTYGDQEFDGVVTTIYPKAEIRDNVVNYVTVLTFQAEADRVLRPEMTTSVRIPIESRDDVLALPIRAIRWEGGRSFVVCRRGDAVERRPVQTGLRDDTSWEIVEGLREGEEVLVSSDIPREGVQP